MNYWLMKSEPSCFSIDDLKCAKNQTSHWDGVRNYQARNYICTMRPGDLCFFYHSNCSVLGIVGTMEVVSEPYPDFTAFDPDSEHPDLKSTPQDPRWYMVDVKFRTKFNSPLTLNAMKSFPQLEEMIILRKGNRLSVTPIKQVEWKFINELNEEPIS
jgi:predicted RNA-binding protein with PUA-like domain